MTDDLPGEYRDESWVVSPKVRETRIGERILLWRVEINIPRKGDCYLIADEFADRHVADDVADQLNGGGQPKDMGLTMIYRRNP